MRAKLLKVEEKKSNQGGTFFYMFFKGSDGHAYKSCVGLAFRNFKNWQAILNRAHENPWLENLIVSPRQPHLIDADSLPKIVRSPETQGAQVEQGEATASFSTLPLPFNWNRGKQKLAEARAGKI